jgi:hypothetical protein
LKPERIVSPYSLQLLPSFWNTQQLGWLSKFVNYSPAKSDHVEGIVSLALSSNEGFFLPLVPVPLRSEGGVSILLHTHCQVWLPNYWFIDSMGTTRTMGVIQGLYLMSKNTLTPWLITHMYTYSTPSLF